MSKISTLPLTSLGAAAAAVVDGLRPAPPGIEIIPCADNKLWHAARSQDVTASVLGAVLGVHEFETPYSLFCKKAGLVTANEDETPAMRRGRLMESVAVQILREDHPDWIIRHNDGDGRLYYRDPEARIGATPDVIAKLPNGELLVVQIKSVAAMTYRQKWIVDREPTPPAWIALQALTEMTLTGADRCAVAPLVIDGFGGIEMPIIEIPVNKSAAIMARAREEVADFWRRVAENDPPPADFSRDAGIISQVYSDDDGSQIDLTGERIVEIIAQREVLKAREADGSAAEKERKVIDAEIISMLGNAARGRLPDGRIVEAKTINRKEYVAKASSYRAVKVKDGR